MLTTPAEVRVRIARSEPRMAGSCFDVCQALEATLLGGTSTNFPFTSSIGHQVTAYRLQMRPLRPCLVIISQPARTSASRALLCVLLLRHPRSLARDHG